MDSDGNPRRHAAPSGAMLRKLPACIRMQGGKTDEQERKSYGGPPDRGKGRKP